MKSKKSLSLKSAKRPLSTGHIKVRVYPDSRRESVNKSGDDRLCIHVKELAAGNRANERVLEIIHSLHPGRSIPTIKGHHAPNKIFQIS